MHALLLRNELLGPAVLSPSTRRDAPGSGGDSAEKRRRASSGSSPGTGAAAGGTASPSRNLFRFRSEHGAGGAGRPPSPGRGPDVAAMFSLSPLGAASERLLRSPRRPRRKVPPVAFKVLDAPALADDYYLHLVDWSAQNVLAVGLGSAVYLWSACTSKVTRLVDLTGGATVTSLAWTQRGTHLAVGTSAGDVQLWEAARCQKVRSMGGHTARVGSMHWNSHTLATGSRDRSVRLRDVRAPEPSYATLQGHRQEVCGLRWSFDNVSLASGGNDNKLLIWDAKTHTQQWRFAKHKAAVKALAWSPHKQGLLGSGGGTADRCIKFWNTSTGSMVKSVDTGSQVCNLVWSKSVNEVCSSHGYSLNQVIVWRYPEMSKVATLTSHTSRVLYMSMSPDGQTIVTGAGDETLRFWNVFPPTRTKAARAGSSLLVPAGLDIR